MKRITVSIAELLNDVNNGTGLLQTQVYRDKLTHAILRHEEEVKRVKLALPPKPKRTRPASALMSLQAWETQNGILRPAFMDGWIKQNRFCEIVIAELISEFRQSMIGKGKLYADFTAAFKTYLNMGYLSKNKEQALKKNSPYQETAYKHQSTTGAGV